MTPGDLRERVDALEQRVDDIETTAADQQGREWSVGDLMSEFQLSRRQALAAFGLLVAGYPLANALTRSVSAGTDEAGQLGSQNYPQDIWAEDIYDKNDNPVAELPGDGSLNISTLTGTDLQYETVFGVSELILKPTGGSGIGEGPPPFSDPYVFDEANVSSQQGRIAIPAGSWQTSGITTDSNANWDEKPVSIEGEGVWISQIAHEDGSSPTISLQGDSGNGGGVRDLAVYGAGLGAGTANIIDAVPQDLIDHVISNVIARYGGGDAINIDGASGTRITNIWAESVSGTALNIDAPRGKIVGAHCTNAETTGAYISGTDFQATGITSWKNGGPGINWDTNGQLIGAHTEGNSGTNIILNGAGATASLLWSYDSGNAGVELNTGVGGQVSQVYVEDATNVGLEVGAGVGWDISQIKINGTGSHGIYVDADDTYLSNVRIDGEIDGFGLRIDSDNVLAENIRITGSIVNDPLRVEGVDVHIHAPYHNWSDMTDNGTRTVLNGVGRNAGDPSSTGDWNGHGVEGILVRDTSNANTHLYNNGSWSQIASA